MELPQVLQIRGSYGLIYTDMSYLDRRGRKSNLINLKNSKTYSGKVSGHASKRIKKTISCFVQKSKEQIIFNPIIQKHQPFTLSFITLTIPDLTTNNQSFYYKHCLKPFLRILSERYDIKDYIWKAELQARGSIHYHLTLNRFLSFGSIRAEWNKIIDKAGLMSSYKLEYKNSDPNSIDVHSVKNIANIEAYLAKYISKVEKGKAALIGKVWGCSSSLQGIKYFSEVITGAIHGQILNLVNKAVLKLEQFDKFSIVRFIDKVDWNVFGLEFGNNYKDWRLNTS